jgi:hypothetical protein
MSATDLMVRPSDPELDGDNRLSHIGRKDDIMMAYVEGTPIEALCGHVFVPSRDPDRYPKCQKCLDVLKAICGAPSN